MATWVLAAPDCSLHPTRLFASGFPAFFAESVGVAAELTDGPCFLPCGGRAKGKRIGYSGVCKAVKLAVQAVGVARVPHDFQRTAIENLEATWCHGQWQWQWLAF